MSITEARIVIPAPTEWLNANARRHWAATSRLVQQWRSATAWHARADYRGETFAERVRITAECHMKTARKFDAANYAPTAKAAVDGLRDAGLLVDDDNDHVIGPDMRAGDPWRTPSLVLVIEVAS